jgi:hypothetical protein
MDQEKKNMELHEEQEVAVLRLDIASEMVLLVYRNLAGNWWWDGLEIKGQVNQDPDIHTRYNLHQTEDSGEYDPFKYPWKPQQLGYIEVTPVSEDEHKPIDVKLVCNWNIALSFWKQLDLILQREFNVIQGEEINGTISTKKENKDGATKVKGSSIIVRSSTNLDVYIPRTKDGLKKWQNMLSVMKKTEKLLHQEWDEGQTKNPKPSILEYIDAIASELGYTVTERTIGRIKAARKSGQLK